MAEKSNKKPSNRRAAPRKPAASRRKSKPAAPKTKRPAKRKRPAKKQKKSFFSRRPATIAGLLVLLVAAAVFLYMTAGDERFSLRHFAKERQTEKPIVKKSGVLKEKKTESRRKAVEKPSRIPDAPTPVRAKPATPDAPTPTLSPREIAPISTPTKPRPTAAPRIAGRIAIVIDDFGNNGNLDAQFIDSGYNFTVAVLPKLHYSRITADRARAKGLEVILHCPMEPIGRPELHKDPGMLRLRMSERVLRSLALENLDSIGGAIGMNNHKGSAFTSDRDAMTIVLGVLKKRGMFFLDSRTSAATVAENTAREMGVPTRRRDIFMDNDNNIEAIRGNIRRLIELALEKGSAIGIGHVRKSTLEALALELPGLPDSGIQLVPVSRLME